MLSFSSHSLTLYRRAGATTLLLFAFYWLTASGAFHSIDEQAVFAVSRNLVLHGEWNQSTLFWGVPYIDQARVGLDGELYAKYGIGHSLLVAGVLALARLIPGAMLASSGMLLNGVATALTGGLLVLSAGRLGYSERVGVTLGLLFGLSTFAWVYAKTMFSEPLVGLGWMAAVWVLLGGKESRQALLAGVILGATVAVRPASVLLVPLFVLPLWDRRLREFGKRLVAFGLPLLLVMVALLGFNHWRFANPLQFGYSESFNGSFLTGLSGFLFSLDRSLFLFAPPLVALFWSVPTFWRRNRIWSATLLAIALISLFIYSLWPVFWGGPVWGPRYLLPVVPLLILLLAPAVEKAWLGGWARSALLLLALAGVAIQVPGVLWNALSETQALGQRYPLWLLPPRVEWLDVAWLVAQSQEEFWISGGSAASEFGFRSSFIPQFAIRNPQFFPVVAVGLVLLALAALRWPSRYLLAGAGVATLLGSGLLLVWLGQSGLGYASQPTYHAVLSRLKEQAQPGDALLLNPAPYQAPIEQLMWWMNEPELTTPLYGAYREPPEDTQVSAQRVTQLLEKHERLWLLTEGVAPGDPNSTAEQLLVARAPIVATEWLEASYRLTLFESMKATTDSGSPNISLGEVATLTEWRVAWPAATNRSLQLTLHWQPQSRTPASEASTASLHTFVQLLNQEGQLVAGWDSVPQAGFAPTPTWHPEQAVAEHITLIVPPDTPASPLRLIAGLYDPATGQRLLTPDGADAITLTELAWPP